MTAYRTPSLSKNSFHVLSTSSNFIAAEDTSAGPATILAAVMHEVGN